MTKIIIDNYNDDDNSILNDMVLVKVFGKLSFKELIRLESVCKQFKACVELTLRSKKCLNIGTETRVRCCDNCDDLSELFGKEVLKELHENFTSTAFGAKEVVAIDLVNHMKLDKVLKKCPNIESISLTECYIDYRTLATIAANCRHLKCLSLDQIYCSISPELWRKVCRRLSALELHSVTVNGLRVLANNSGYFYRSFEYSCILLKQLSNENKRKCINKRNKNKNKFCEIYNECLLFSMIIELNYLSVQNKFSKFQKKIQNLSKRYESG